jgi:SAM-dependent methyltransferase
MPDRVRTRELAAEYIRKGDPLGWFEALYQEAERGDGAIPWADQEPNPRLLEFWKTHPLETADKRALVIGSGFGDDSEQLAAWGFQTTGFDISKTAIENTKKRYPASKVAYVVADLFDPPKNWLRAFDFVLEIYTVQALVGDLRAQAVTMIAQFVAPGGQLLVIARGREENEPEAQGPPWPLTRTEIDGFRRVGLKEASFEDYADPEPPWVRRFRALYRRPQT